MGKGLFEQVIGYSRSGVGWGAAFLKHSLYPIDLLKAILPADGVILDLGCGEGMLTNLLAKNLAGARFRGIDTDFPKIELALRNAPPNASFICEDINKCEYPPSAAAIFNDVLHHRDDAEQSRMLAKAFALLDDDGILILKEVDARDAADRLWTRYWDRKLYPNDSLNFHTSDQWVRILNQAGFRLLAIHRVTHPWPAARTIFVATKRPQLPHLPRQPRRSGRPPWRVLVTGGTGFVGQHLVRELLQSAGPDGRPIEVSVIARESSFVPRDWMEESYPVHILRNDLAQPLLDDALGGFDYVFHLAANVDFYADQATAQENVAATAHLLRAVSHPRLKRFILASTVGAVDRSPSDDCTHPLDERSPTCPASRYGHSKLESERAVRNAGLPHTIVRLPWCYGPGMASRHHLRFLFENNLRGGLVFKIDWPGRVSIIEVRQLARVLWRVAMTPTTLDGTYFVSDGCPISFGSLFRAMGAINGRKTGFIRIPAPLVKVGRRLRRVLPFQLKCLLLDAMTVSPKQLQLALAAPLPQRADGFLLPLARYVHQEQYPGRTRYRVVITGAASGLGKALAEQCYAAGYHLLLVDCDGGALREVGSHLQAEVLVADLSQPEHVDVLAERISRAGYCPDLLINNAGIGLRSGFAATAPYDLNNLLGVNCAAPMKLMSAFVRQCLNRGSGTLVNIGSSAALQPLPYMAAYSASKAFLVNLSEAVAGELLANPNSGSVEIITVIPSGMATNFQTAAGVKREADEKLLEPSEVARIVLGKVGRGSRTLVIGSTARMMSLAARVVPRGWQARLWERMMKAMR